MSNAKKLANGCVKHARATLGNGWNHVSDEVRWGLVSASILGIFMGQDESIAPSKVCALIADIESAAREIIYGEKDR